MPAITKKVDDPLSVEPGSNAQYCETNPSPAHGNNIPNGHSERRSTGNGKRVVLDVNFSQLSESITYVYIVTLATSDACDSDTHNNKWNS